MGSKQTERITVATYNVLAAAYVKPKYFGYCHATTLAATGRYPRIVERVVKLDSDVICLQEVDIRLFRMLQRRLEPLGYRGRWSHKDGLKPDGVATFARAPMRWREVRIVSLDSPHDPESSGHTALVTRLHGHHRHLTVVNTHLNWDEPDVSGMEHAGFQQAEKLLAAVAEETSCTVVCGDFNAGPHTGLLRQFLRAGFMDGDLRDRPTCMTSGRLNKIDYVLVRAQKDQAVRINPKPHPLLKSKFPSKSEPSDHIPVISTIVF